MRRGCPRGCCESDKFLFSISRTRYPPPTRRSRPDITLMDLQMPIMSGIEALAAIREEFSDAKIIVLTTYSGDIQASRALKLGAASYLLKDMLRVDLVETIRCVYAGQRKIPAET